MSSGSSFENLPPRIQLRILDNLEGKYPTTSRSGNRTGVFSSSFNDTNTLIFQSESNMSFPQMMASSSLFISSSYILGSGFARKGVTDSLITFETKTPNFGPFKEDSLFALEETSFFLTSTIDDRFNSKLKDKVSFKIDISPAEMSYHTRNATKRNNLYDPAGRFSSKDITGFSYFNFDLKRWEMIGLTDPETGVSTHFDWALESAAPSGTLQVTGTENWPSQFMAYGAISNINTSVLTTSASNYSCLPTIANFAPIANKYHATSSQTLKLSNYINRPFLLENIVVELPVQVERFGNSGSFTDSLIYAKPQEDYIFFIYRQENTHVPTYNQNESDLTFRSTALFATGSNRFLICSGVMSFYNNKTAEKLGPAVFVWPFQTASFTPQNSPTFQHDWNMTAASDTRTDPQYTGSIRLNIKTAVASRYHVTPAELTMPISNGAIANNFEGAQLYHAWPGGTSCLPFGKNNKTGKMKVTSSIMWINFSNTWYAKGGLYDSPIQTIGGIIPEQTVEMNTLRLELFDPRAQKVMGAGSDKKSIESQYILLPSDEIVFGLEAAFSIPEYTQTSLILSGAQNTTFMTGALMKIMPENSTVTFYGDFVKNQTEYDAGLSQFLTTNNVNETIQETDLDSDQFRINLKEETVSSYTDRINVGSIFTTASNVYDLNDTWRHTIFSNAVSKKNFKLSTGLTIVYDLIILNNYLAGATAIFKPANSLNIVTKLERNNSGGVQLIDLNERFYDSLLPDFEDYLTLNNAIHTGSYFYSSSAWINESLETNKLFKFAGDAIVAANDNNFLKASLRYLENNGDSLIPYPYANNPTRKILNNKVSLIFSQSSSTSYQERLITSQEGISLILFSRGFTHEVSNGTTILGTYHDLFKYAQHRLIGSSGTKYGIHSVFPSYTKQVYRSNHYGQFRDLLEQRQFSIFYDEIEKNTGKKGKILGPIDIQFQTSPSSSYCAPTEVSGSSNRSMQATSSLPYIDDKYYNWGTII